ncbi:hypothetical protein WJX82_005563 [Trebouxia sp. C0006]
MPSHCLHTQLGASQVCRQAQIPQHRVAAFADSKRLQSSFANRSAARHRTASLKCTAASESNNSVATAATTGRIGTITLTEDKETIQDVMAFTGPAPERVNGRLAMLAFVAVAFGELTSHKSVLEQVPTVPFRIIFVSLLISAASIIPKYSSGTSLHDLTEAASRTGLPPQLKFFNKTHEVWVGRVAMLGFTGLIIVELFKGGALFG